MRLVFLGPPGAGKGTQASRLAEHFEVPHIATGDMYRHMASQDTERGREIKQIMERGDLIPDEITNQLVQERIAEQDAQKGFILDGYPRNVAQATELERALEEIGAKLDAVLRFMVTGDAIVARLSGRRVCPVCKTVYHIETNPPSEQGICDRDGATLIQRKDDEPDAIRRRLDVYGEQTRPLFDFYADKGLLRDVDALGDPDEVFSRLLEAVEG